MNPVRLLPLVIACALPGAVHSAEGDARDWMLPKELPPVTPAQAAMKDVPFSPGAPAVVLFEGEQQNWSGLMLMRQTIFRRVKILSPAGIDGYSDFEYVVGHGGRIQKIEARTVLPGGTIVDAADKIHRERSDDGNRKDDDDIEHVQVTFPRVEVGAILDFLMLVHHDGYFIDPYAVQQDIPVVESRFVLVPPNGLPFRSAVANLPLESADPVSFRHGETHGHAWSFTDVPALPELPNMPPAEEVAQAIVIVYGQPGTNTKAEWRTFAREAMTRWEEWLQAKKGLATDLAKRVAGSAVAPRDKAEAIRKALRDRVSVTRASVFPSHDGADSVLEAGKGTSADLAGLTVAMLRAVDVPAKLAMTRRRGSGGMPSNLPVKGLYDDYLVAVSEGDGPAAKDVYYSPGARVPVGQLEWRHVGVMAVPLGKDVEGPVQLPAVPAEGNRESRQVQASLDASGNLSAQAVVTWTGTPAEAWRGALAGKSHEEQVASVQESVREGVPAAVVSGLLVEGLDDPSRDLVLTFAFTAEGHATRAGARLLVEPFLLSSIDASDWAAETRTIDVDFGTPFLEEETVMLRLPEGTVSARHPAPSTMDAGETGRYETAFEGKGQVISCRRTLRLAVPRFSAANWVPLRKWFLDMATNDEQPVVIEMGD